jgi:hypothetical protein
MRARQEQRIVSQLVRVLLRTCCCPLPPMRSREIHDAARDAGLAWRTLERAKHRLGVQTDRVGYGATGQWYWRLREQEVAVFEPGPVDSSVFTPIMPKAATRKVVAVSDDLVAASDRLEVNPWRRPYGESGGREQPVAKVVPHSQLQNSFGGFRGQVLGQVEQTVLVCLANVAQPLRRHAVCEKLIVRNRGEGLRLGLGLRLSLHVCRHHG